MRLDRALAEITQTLSRRTVQSLCERGRITCRGRTVHKSDLVQAGQEFLIQLDAERRAAAASELELAVRYESESWIVACKPALQPTAPTHGLESNTFANALLARYPELAKIGHHALEPGLLHRLDNGTSGLIVAARTRFAFEAATRALKRGLWTKRYLALVEGSQLPSAGTLVGQLRADRRHRKRVALAEALELRGASAEFDVGAAWPKDDRNPSLRHTTHFRVLHELGEVTYVEVTVGTAFRHQIRAHFAAAGWPLVNDEVYGARREPRLELTRHALHAARVAWPGCDGLEGFDVCEPVPDDLASLLDVTRFADS